MRSSEDEKRCPLCAEEMDWTDQQFKPCKCGYQVCVWCWHHIMDMAEKDETEGRCPACRTIYEKGKIVAMQANCERMASNRKNKPPKAKLKTNETKKDLTNIRVIQRKMAYVIGLPLNLADEDILWRKEYFGQYGKITKISLSRTAGGAIQQFVYDTCSVYITYSKEDEAIRCIQSIHGFNMDGRLLRASFGTAKYCHAWLRNLPCNNPACLYLHSFGAEEDSFSKDEEAAVQTRIRLQQVVGDANNSLALSGIVLPPPVDELNNTASARNLDPSPGGMSSSCHVSNMLQSKIKDGCIGATNKITTFVDVVGKPNSVVSQKDGNIVEDKRMLSLCSDLSSLTFDKDMHDKKPYSCQRLYNASSSDHIMKRFYLESKDIPNAPYREDFRSLNIQGSDSCNRMTHISFLHTSYPKDIQEDSVGQFSLHEMSHSASNFSKDHNSIPIQKDEAPGSIISVNSVPDDRFHETKFRSSAKTDRIYRSSNSFSNEEIVEHLRRIDDEHDNELDNGDDNSSLAALERRVISDIVSSIFDTGDDSSKLPNSLSEIDDDNNKFHHSPSLNSPNSDNTCFPFVKQDIYATQVAEYGTSVSNRSQISGNCSLQDHYLYKSQITASKPQIIAPPGFSNSRRDPPLWFSASERTDRLSRVSSGNHLMDNSAFLTTLLQNPSTNNGTFGDIESIDFSDPAVVSCGKSRTTYGLCSPCLELKQSCALPLNGFRDEESLWSLMQQSSSSQKDFKLTQTLLPQASSTPQQTWHPSQNGDWICNLDQVYGFSEQQQAYDPSSLTLLSEQNFSNGHISSRYQRNSDGVQLRNEVAMPDHQTNESLGCSKYFPGYGDMRFQMPVSGEVYTRLFGM